MAFVRLDSCVQIRTVDLDVAFGRELHADRRVTVAFQLHADADDSLLVAKQSLGFLPDKRLERRCQVEMNAGDDQFVGIWAVHCYCVWVGLTKEGMRKQPLPK
jgi:hypothetical protein